jgi:predicted nucleic acid-binding protein
MATADVLMDSSGFLALWDATDSFHELAIDLQRELVRKRSRFFVTDYVVDEAITLLRVRHSHAAAADFIDTIQKTAMIQLEWITLERFRAAAALFRKHNDKEWSFTDCVSFVVMRELRIRNAFSTDHNFSQAGFVPLLSSKS